MMTRQELEGGWNKIKGQIQDKWGQLTDDDLLKAKGDANQLIGIIQSRTGETRRAVESFLDECKDSCAPVAQQVVDTARNYAHQAKDMAYQAKDVAQQQFHTAVDSVQSGVTHAQRVVRRSPMESIAVAFGAGMIAGVVTALAMRSSRS